MSKEPKKKPGDMQRARKRHLQQQARRDALTKLRKEGLNDIWAHYDNGSALVTVHAVESDIGDYVLAVVGKRLKVMYFSDYQENGIRVADDYQQAVIPSKQIFGVVSRFLDFHWKCPDCGTVRKLSNNPVLTNEDQYYRTKYYTYDMTCQYCAISNCVMITNRVDE